MIVAIHQPSYFPWLGLLHKIRHCDTFVVMDEVQLADRAFQHRNLFLDGGGRAQYLSIPFARSGYRDRPLRELRIAADDWRQRHWDFLRSNYGRHPFAAELMPSLQAFYAAAYETLFEPIWASMALALSWFGLRPRVVRQSSLEYDRTLRKGELIVALARAAGGSVYLSGTGAQAYLQEADFGPGFELRFNRFQHPRYPQRNAGEFVEGLACLDLLFNVGSQRAGAILREECGA